MFLPRKTPPIAPWVIGIDAILPRLWWNGPTWLKGSSTTWPRRDLEMSDEQTRP
ncbi:hypothetical protein HN011_008229, partial [Eciton burchellii]